MKTCPKCGEVFSEEDSNDILQRTLIRFECGSEVDKETGEWLWDGATCLTYQRDQLIDDRDEAYIHIGNTALDWSGQPAAEIGIDGSGEPAADWKNFLWEVGRSIMEDSHV